MNYISKNVMRLGFTILLLFVSFATFSQSQEFEPLNAEKVLADADSIKMEMDSTFFYIKETFMLLKDGVRILGVKKTIQISSGIFFKIIFWVGLYLLWRKKRK